MCCRKLLGRSVCWFTLRWNSWRWEGYTVLVFYFDQIQVRVLNMVFGKIKHIIKKSEGFAHKMNGTKQFEHVIL